MYTWLVKMSDTDSVEVQYHNMPPNMCLNNQ